MFSSWWSSTDDDTDGPPPTSRRMSRNSMRNSSTRGSRRMSRRISSRYFGGIAETEGGESPIIALSKHLLNDNGSIKGQDIEDATAEKYTTFASTIPLDLSEQPALASIDGRKPLTHKEVHDFIVNDYGSMLHSLGFGRGDRVALVLPNGPELALAIVSTLNWATCVPLSAKGAASELEADLERCGATLVIGPFLGGVNADDTLEKDTRFQVFEEDDRDWTGLKHVKEIADRLNIPYVGLAASPTRAGAFKLVLDDSAPFDYSTKVQLTNLRYDGEHDEKPTERGDEGLLLFTSGTTGNKKCVPHQMGDMITAAVTITLSWDLTPKDVNCNLMPLFHVGGIVRQVFSPLVSGGCVICCPSFDSDVFWTLLAKKAFTWYYAAPTMHEQVLHAYEDDDHGCDNPQLRMIANAAGGLPHSLAVKLRTLFKSNVLPSYGSTEAMPVSSPPASYELEKPGCSGIPVGPEVSIQDPQTGEMRKVGTEGAICVRGPPIFRGYAPLANDPEQKVPEAFTKDGWFNTGDNGYLDRDGYIYVTGRSKEVINRGGEIISPLEIDGIVLKHPDVKTCTAFSAKHDILQECVGIALVMKKGKKRLDLPTLNEYLLDKLEPAKVPQCMVFMEDLPKSHTNKVLRIKLGERFGLPTIHDDMPAIERTFEAECPPKGTSMKEPIKCELVSVSIEHVQSTLADTLKLKAGDEIVVKPHPKLKGSLVCYSVIADRQEVIEAAKEDLDSYCVPRYYVNVDDPIQIDNLPSPTSKDAMIYILRDGSSMEDDPVVEEIQQLFADTLKLDYTPEPWDSFFQIGGSSMLASQIASGIRKNFGVSMNGSEIFRNSTPEALGKLISERKDSSGRNESRGKVDLSHATDGSMSLDSQRSLVDHGAPFDAEFLKPRNNIFKTIFQLFPLLFVFPLWQISRYLLFFRFLLWALNDLLVTDIGAFIITYIIFSIAWMTVVPLVFVLIKWVVIGRYKEGRYAIYSSYYLRWWFVDICRKLLLRGVWGMNSTMLSMYYRMLGAKIGSAAEIDPGAEIAEFDLVSIGSGAAIDKSRLRPFGLSNGAMILGSVSVGDGASVGVKSIVAPHTCVPDGTHLGPCTVSYDNSSLNDKNAKTNRMLFPQPNIAMKLFVVFPLTVLIEAFSLIPPFIVLYFLIRYKGSFDFANVGDLMMWLTDPGRIPFYIGIRLARTIISPFFFMFASMLVKWIVIGKFKEGPRGTSQWQKTRHLLAATLFSKKKIQSVTDLIGRHYEIVSWLYRMLGARVGKRVFWPGNQPATTGELDLLQIGDDVVFGSRSAIMMSTSETCEYVTLCAGSNVADNCVVMPGSILGKHAVLGSNTICPRGRYLPEGSVWFGSKGGEPQCLKSGVEDAELGRAMSKLGFAKDAEAERIVLVGDKSTLRPFGKAFYKKDATYCVIPLPVMFVIVVLVSLFINTFHTLPLLAALYAATHVLYGVGQDNPNFDTMTYSYAAVFFSVFVAFILANLIRSILVVMMELTAKWTIMGRRREGKYNYDKSSYTQRWEVYLLIGKILRFNRLNVMDFLSGSPYMTAFFRAKGATIGKDVCLYPTGASPYMPEPDLVTIGDRSAIDCAAIVDHLNTKGNFVLKKIKIGNDCTLRALSRVQQGTIMEDGSMLVEKALAMTGEVVDAYSVWQGVPAQFWFGQSKADRKPDIV